MTSQAGFVPHVMTLGAGPRRVLALHCTLAFGGAWAGVARQMGDQTTFIAPDMPSHGRSPDWDGRSDFPETAYRAVAGLLDAPVDVIGHSFGACLALRLAVEHPEKLRSLTLIEPVFFCIAAADAPESLADHDAQAQPFNDAITAGDAETAARAFNRMWSNGPRWDDMPAATRAAMTRAIHVVPDCAAFLYEDTAGLVPRLDRVTMPTLLLRGSRTHPAIAAVNDGLTARMGAAEQAVIGGAGHMAPITHPAEVAAAWQDVLNRA